MTNAHSRPARVRVKQKRLRPGKRPSRRPSVRHEEIYDTDEYEIEEYLQ